MMSLEVVCAECGENLELTVSNLGYDITLKIETCKSCSDEAVRNAVARIMEEPDE